MKPPANEVKEMPIDGTHEFVALRAEILSALKDVRALERYVLVTTGAMWAWLIVHRVDDWRAWGIPVLLVFVGLIRTISIMQHLGTMGRYIREYLHGGYEQFLEKRRLETPLLRRGVRFVSDFGSWFFLQGFTVTAFYWGPKIVSSLKLPNCVVPK